MRARCTTSLVLTGPVWGGMRVLASRTENKAVGPLPGTSQRGQPFNYAALNNRAVAECDSELFLFLNDDTEGISEGWLLAMVELAMRPEVGAVGAKLLYPDGSIQHGGVVLGLRGPAEHPFVGQPMDAGGYMHRLHVDQNYSAVTAACLMVRKSVYDRAGVCSGVRSFPTR